MTTNIGTTINAYYDSNHNVQYSPNNQIQVPADTYETVVWKSIPPMRFKSTDSAATNLSNIASGKIAFVPPATGPLVYTDSITMTIDNTGGPNNVSAQVTLGVADMTSQPPVVIDGGGSIRNKGTSIWVPELVAIVTAVLFGVLIARLIGATPKFGMLAAAAVVGAVCIGAVVMVFHGLS
jgi:hypothetical protein